MNNASTGDARGADRPTDAEPFFPSEGPFSTVVPLSEVGRAPAVRGGGADAGKPAEAEWARAADRAERAHAGEEETLVPARTRRGRAAAARGPRADEGRRSLAVTTLVLLLSVAAGVASGAYLLSSSGRFPEARQPAPPRVEEAQVAAEAPAAEAAPTFAAPPPPEAAGGRADADAEKAGEAEKVEKVEKTNGVVSAPRETRAAPAEPVRAQRPARASAEAAVVAPAPKPAPSRAPAPPPPRTVTRAQRRPPAAVSSGGTLPVSSPPPSARSKKVIQWP